MRQMNTVIPLRTVERDTIPRIFFGGIDRHGRDAAMMYKAAGQWHALSDAEVERRVTTLAVALSAAGVASADRVVVLAENRPEWAMADYGCLNIGAASVPIYPTLPAEQIPHILNDAGAAVVIVSTPEQAAKLAAIRGQCATLRHLIGLDAGAADGCDLTLAELEARGAAVESAERNARYEREALAVGPDDLATLIYTSGTTGTPKGVMLTHDNFHSNVAAAKSGVVFDSRDVALSFLPLSHVFEREGDYMYWSCGTTIAYVASIEDVSTALQEVKPTIAMGVPRLYEKMYARVFENGVSGGAVKKRIFFWELGVADRWADEKLAGREPGGALAMQYRMAQKLVFSKLQARTGGRLRYFVSGGAPLAPEINKFFYAAGIVILEGYGLTETSPVIAVNSPEHFRIGTVGRPIPGVEVKIASDGEILARGPNIMKGYYNKPDATAEAIDADGWFHTGDIGRLEDGFLRITDRKKDIIVTAGGKNIAPQPIENAVKTSKYVSQAVMLGDKRKFPSLLVVPEWDALEKWAQIKKLDYTSRRALLDLPITHAKIEKEVRAKLAGLAPFETPKKIGILEHEFSIERGELTPKLSVKRKVVSERYKDVIDALYAEDATRDAS